MSISERISHIMLEVTNLEKSTKFYQDILGFEIASREKMKDGREVVVFYQGIGLTPRVDKNFENKILNHVGIKVNDVDMLISNLNKAKVKIIDGPSSSNYGTKLYFLDPDGIRLECHEKFRS